MDLEIGRFRTSYYYLNQTTLGEVKVGFRGWFSSGFGRGFGNWFWSDTPGFDWFSVVFELSRLAQQKVEFKFSLHITLFTRSLGGGELWLKGRVFAPVGIVFSRSLYSSSCHSAMHFLYY